MKSLMVMMSLCAAMTLIVGCGESEAVRMTRVEKVQSVLSKNANGLFQDFAKTLSGTAKDLIAKVKVEKVDVVLGENKTYTANIALVGTIESKSISVTGKELDDGKIEFSMNQDQAKAVLGEIMEAGEKKDAEIAAAIEAASWFAPESAIQKYVFLRDFACREPYRSRRIGTPEKGAVYKYEMDSSMLAEVYKVMQVVDGGVLAIMDIGLDVGMDPDMTEYTSAIILIKTKKSYVTNQRLQNGFYAFRGIHTYRTARGGSNTVYVFQDVMVRPTAK